MAGAWSIRVSSNWRVVLRFEDNEDVDVDSVDSSNRGHTRLRPLAARRADFPRNGAPMSHGTAGRYPLTHPGTER